MDSNTINISEFMQLTSFCSAQAKTSLKEIVGVSSFRYNFEQWAHLPLNITRQSERFYIRFESSDRSFCFHFRRLLGTRKNTKSTLRCFAPDCNVKKLLSECKILHMLNIPQTISTTHFSLAKRHLHISNGKRLSAVQWSLLLCLLITFGS